MKMATLKQHENAMNLRMYNSHYTFCTVNFIYRLKDFKKLVSVTVGLSVALLTTPRLTYQAWLTPRRTSVAYLPHQGTIYWAQFPAYASNF